jgi:aerobic carbon-monoxide dehydrogenase small subunit
MKETIQIHVNGERHGVAVQPYDTLLNVLRDQLCLKGSKQGCDTGSCGCCSVHVDGKVVYSCMTYAKSVGEAHVRTVEGLSSGDQLDPLQQAFIDAGAVQCGYCTAGMLMAARQLLDRNPSPTNDEIRQGLSGNLCRCTGYHKIVEAVALAASRSAA